MRLSNDELEWLVKQYNIASQFAASIALLCNTSEVTPDQLPVSNIETDVLFSICSAYMSILDRVVDEEFLLKTTSTKTLH